jgi:hypothetical protein
VGKTARSPTCMPAMPAAAYNFHTSRNWGREQYDIRTGEIMLMARLSDEVVRQSSTHYR